MRGHIWWEITKRPNVVEKCQVGKRGKDKHTCSACFIYPFFPYFAGFISCLLVCVWDTQWTHSSWRAVHSQIAPQDFSFSFLLLDPLPLCKMLTSLLSNIFLLFSCLNYLYVGYVIQEQICVIFNFTANSCNTKCCPVRTRTNFLEGSPGHGRALLALPQLCSH